jgi:hypothetical protein
MPLGLRLKWIFGRVVWYVGTQLIQIWGVLVYHVCDQGNLAGKRAVRRQ